MEFILGLALVIVLVIIISRQSSIRKREEILQELKVNWGNPKGDDLFGTIPEMSAYCDLTEPKYNRLTDQTKADVDFDDLFQHLDRTISRVGQQYFYKKLSEPSDLTTDPLARMVAEFTNDLILRERVQKELIKLNSDDAYTITSLLSKNQIEKPSWYWVLPISLVSIPIMAILSIWFPVSLIGLIVPFGVNIYIHLWNKGNTLVYLKSIPQLNILTNVCRNLSQYQSLNFDEKIGHCIVEMKRFQRKSRLIRFKEEGLGDDVSQFVSDIIKAILLIEVISLFSLLEELKSKTDSILIQFEYLGQIDSAMSISALRASKQITCIPKFIPTQKSFMIKNGFHPLIENCTPNDLKIDGKSVLITGSNMSGKSTFLRTIAINSILAQTIFTCFADEYRAPILKQFCSIRIDDNLFEGKSYFFEEVSVVGELIEESNKEKQCIFLLDEVFKGTNTVERIASAKAILSYLNQGNNIVLVATHDIELANLLKDDYDLYHFTEIIENNQLQFDHSIKPGPLKTRNAIKLLELAQYPQQIITDAKNVIGKGDGTT